MVDILDDPTAIRLMSLAQLARRGTWQLELAHDRGENLLVWMTRGQGLAILDGARRGIGTHNAIFVPARNLMSFDIGRQGYGQALLIPDGTELILPHTVQHLRIRDVGTLNELTALLDALGREQNAMRSLRNSAVSAYADLISIWLRRQMRGPEMPSPRVSAARRLCRAYCAVLVTEFATGATMADHARTLGVTPTHLTRVCRSEMGKTAATLLNERILFEAQHLLISTNVAVQDIARHLGFGSAAYFTRYIQQHTGKSPTALRTAAAVRG